MHRFSLKGPSSVFSSQKDESCVRRLPSASLIDEDYLGGPAPGSIFVLCWLHLF